MKRAIYGLREAPRLWQQERDHCHQKLRDLEFMYKNKLAHLVQSHIHPSLWFIAECPRVSTPGKSPFDHSLRSDEWTVRLHDHQILGYVGVYVDDLLIAGPRFLNDSLIKAVQQVWKRSTPEHLGPDVLRFLGMNLERVDADKSVELELPVGTILLNQMECIIEVLIKFEPSLQLKVRTIPGNQESFATKNASLLSTDEVIQEYLQSLQALVQDEIIEADKVKKTSPKLHYNSDQVPVNLPAIQCSIYGPSETSPSFKECFHGQCSKECTVPEDSKS